MSISFSEVRQILDDIMNDWEQKHGRTPDLPLVHGDPNFGWQTRDQLLNSEGFAFRLIDPSMIGNGQGHQTNLVLALTTGVQGLSQMPSGGPFVSSPDVQKIIQWIDEGCLDEADCQRRDTPTDIMQTVEMLMRDPDVNKQADLDPYPHGPGKLLHKWSVSVRCNTNIGPPIALRVPGIPRGTAGVRPGDIFDANQRNDIYQATGHTYEGLDTAGCLVLHRALSTPSIRPAYDPGADHFPDPNQSYPARNIEANGKWFVAKWEITHNDGTPTLTLSADQQPRVSNVTDRRCP